MDYLFEKCCGCRACEQICPQKCIEMKEDEEGFLRAVVSNEKCLKCGACKKVCDFNFPNNDLYLTPIKTFAAVSVDKDVLRKSSSGGAFMSLCYSIDCVEVVYGCVLSHNLRVEHTRVEGIHNLSKLQKSKYVQSNTNHTYSECKKDLDNGKTVIYSGTPCQIAGLKSYLKKEYLNLYTIGLVCHGVPSQKLFNNYIESLEKKYKIKIDDYSFRDKHVLLGDTEIGICFSEGKRKIHLGWAQDYFMNLYLRGLCYRPDCYDCIYANPQIKRPEDITIADCWNARDVAPKFDAEKGVSTIIFNNKRLLGIENNLKKYMSIQEISISDFAADNSNLIRPTTKPSEERNNIYKRMISGMSFDKNAAFLVSRLGYPHYMKVLKNIIHKIIKGDK